MSSIFLSHNREDKPFAKMLECDLKKYGIKVWIDEAELNIGDSLLKKIDNAIRETEYFGVLISNNSLNSDWVQRELEIAMNLEINEKKVRVLPLLLEDCTLPSFLGVKLFADFTSKEKYQSELNKLVKTILGKSIKEIEEEESKAIVHELNFINNEYPVYPPNHLFLTMEHDLRRLRHSIEKDIERINSYETRLLSGDEFEDLEVSDKTLQDYIQRFDSVRREISEKNIIPGEFGQLLNKLLGKFNKIDQIVKQKRLLKYFDESEIAILNAILSKLKKDNLKHLEDSLELIKIGEVAEEQIQSVVVELKARLTEIMLLKTPLSDDIDGVLENVDSQNKDIKEKLKILLPLVPLIMNDKNIPEGINIGIIKEFWNSMKEKSRKQGKIIKIQDSSVYIEFPKGMGPVRNHLLEVKLDNGSTLILKVVQNIGKDKVRAIAVDSLNGLRRGMRIENTEKCITVPVGDKVLGRMLDFMGNSIDGRGEIDERISVSYDSFAFQNFGEKSRFLETGIKVIDLMAPLFIGDKIGLIGGRGVGKTFLILELLRNHNLKGGNSIITGLSDRTKWGCDLYITLLESGFIDKCAIILGQQSKHPEFRLDTLFSALTIAEYSCEIEQKDIILFSENLFSVMEPSLDLSALLGGITNSPYYRSFISRELKKFFERLNPKKGCSFTSVHEINILEDEFISYAIDTTSSNLDSLIIFKRDLTSMGLYPPIDPILSYSPHLHPNRVGERHFQAAQKTKKFLARYDELKDMIALLGFDDISDADKLMIFRARKLQKFLSQPFFAGTSDQRQLELPVDDN